MKTWFTASALAAQALPGLPRTERAIQIQAARSNWQSRPREGRGGGREYHVSSLPEPTRAELARLAVAEQAVQDEAPAAPRNGALAGLDGKRQDRAAARVAIVNRFETWRAMSGESLRAGLKLFARGWSEGLIEGPEWLRRALPTVSAGSLWNWRVKLQAGEAAALAGQYKGRREQGRIEGDDELRAYVVGFVRNRPHVNALHVLRALQTDLPAKTLPSLRRLRAWIARWRDEEARALEIATDPDMARRRRKPAFASPASNIVRINQRWEMDGTPADVMCTDGRHVVVGLIDVATRRARVLVARTSQAVAVTALIKRAILAWGVPELIASDNGKEFASQHVAQALGALDIRQHFCRPYDPDGKPFIERFFGTLTRGLFELLPGYVGHSVAERQAIRNRSTFARRMGQSDEAAFQVALSAAELQQACDDWLATDYERRPHDGLNGRSPFQVAAQLARGARFLQPGPAGERALDVLLAPVPGDGWRVVGKKGIEVDRFSYIAPELGGLIGDRVKVRYDVADLGRIVVFDEAGRFVCVAEDPAVTGLDRATVQAKARAAYQAIDAEHRDQARREKRELGLDDVAQRMIAARAKQAGRLVAFPAPPAEIVTTPALDAAAEAARALDDPAAAAPAPSYLELPEDERQSAPAEVIRLTPADADPFPGWGDSIAIYDWHRRNPTRGVAQFSAEQLAARIQSWRADDPGLDVYIREFHERPSPARGGAA